jgi:FtsH-binding integral membrane protein
VNVAAALAWRDDMVADYSDAGQQRWLANHGIDLLRGARSVLRAPGITVIYESERRVVSHMAQALTHQQMGTTARGQAHALFAQTMAYVAATAGIFALGAWAGRNLSGGVGIVAFIAAFACLIGMRFAARRSAQLTVWLLLAFGLLIGLAVAPTLAYYGNMDPRALWEAGGATALFIAGFGAAGYATRRDLTALARVSFWALLALIVAGIVLIFVHIPGAELAYSVLGLVIFAGFTMFDFQRLRTNTDTAAAPLLAASIFLDVLNVFLFFLEIFSGAER